MQDVLPRHLLERDDGVRPRPIKLLNHPLDDERLGVQADDGIAQGHHERLVANQGAGAEDRVSEAKLAALELHRSQVAGIDYGEAVQGLNRYRGAMSGRGRYCECFQVIRAEGVAP